MECFVNSIVLFISITISKNLVWLVEITNPDMNVVTIGFSYFININMNNKCDNLPDKHNLNCYWYVMCNRNVVHFVALVT